MATVLAATLMSTGCRDDDPVRAPASLARTTLATCAATFTMVSFEEDSTLQSMGMPPELDSLSVCQTWTGIDYDVRVTQTAHLDTILAPPEDVPTAVQSVGGVMTFEDRAGVVQPTTVQAGTVLGFLEADAELTAAVEADPYFNVRAVGECDAAPDPDGLCPPTDSTGKGGDPCFDGTHYLLCDQEPMALNLGASVVSARVSGVRGALVVSPDRPGRHGIRRPGVRELIENATEIAGSRGSERRFRRTSGDVVKTFTVDRLTGLLIVEDEESPGHSMHATHTWRRARGGWVLARMEHSSVDVDERGQRWPSRGLTEILDVRLR